MMKKITTITLLILLLCSCNENELFSEYTETTKIKSLSTLDVPKFSFDSITNPIIWKKFRNLEEMQEACQIPDNLLTKLSTPELIEICMNYPLFINYLAYDDYKIGLTKVMDSFNGFNELYLRNDAKESLLNYYNNISISKVAMNAQNKTYLTNNNSITPIKLEFIELILSKFAENDETFNNMLVRNFNYKLIEKAVYPEIFVSDKSNKAVLKDANTVTTKFGKPITYINFNEFSHSEIQDINTRFINLYPNAIFLNNASRTYNCHSYAWNMTEGGQTCWINATINIANDNLSKYWTKDYYSLSNNTNSPKIFYYKSDHSAIKSTVQGMYESKWGQAPLMRHAPEYGPYENMTDRNYYNHTKIHGILKSNSTEYFYKVGDEISFGPSDDVPIGSNIKCRYKLLTRKGDDFTLESGTVKYGLANDWFTVTFNKVGIYEFTMEYYLIDTGETIAAFSCEPIVEI